MIAKGVRKMGILQKRIKVGRHELCNRLVMPPMATEFSDSGIVTDKLIQHYEMRSRGGCLGLVTVEHSFVSPEGKASKNQLSAADDTVIPGLARLAEAIHANRTPAILQINHAGSAFRPFDQSMPLVGPSPVFNPHNTNAIRNGLPLPKELDQQEIDRIRSCFVSAALRAKEAGLDGVEVHCAHGYLLDAFYSPLTNHRTDVYTGSTMEGRTRLQVEILREIRQRAGEDFLLSIRLGASDYTQGGADISEVAQACRIFEAAGADMISISGGMCFYTRPDYKEPGWFSELSEEAKKAVDIPVLLTGGIQEYADAARLLKEGKADLIGLGRSLLKDRRIAKKMIETDSKVEGEM